MTAFQTHSEEGDNVTSTLTSMAMVKVNYDRYGQDLLENFVPFVADRIFHAKHDIVSVPLIRDNIREEYGLSIPLGVLRTLVKRCVRRGLVYQEAGVYRRTPDGLEPYDLSGARADVARKHSALVQLGLSFARTYFGHPVSEEEFEAGLQSFIRTNSAPLLSTVVDGQPIAHLEETKTGTLRYIVGAFVEDLTRSSPEGFSYFAEVVKGSLLASALYFPDASSVNQKLDKLSIYFDTTVLLRAIGASGPELQEFAVEILSLAQRLGAKLRCFEHTLTELHGVLDACKANVKAGRGMYFGESSEYMVANGWGVSDVIALADAAERQLAKLGVRIVEKPEHVERLTLAETQLEEILMDEVHYKSPSAMRRDVDSISAIYRIRRGHEYRQIERSRAAFVTSNTALVRGARKYARIERFDRETVPLCFADYVLTTLMWLKAPLIAPDLPSRQIVADCHAAMRPKDDVWLHVVAKIEKLRQNGGVTDDDYTLMRQSIHVRSVIMVHIDDNPEAFTEGAVETILARAKSNIAAQAIADVAEERQQRSMLAAELARTKDDLAARDARLDQRANMLARATVRVVMAILAPIAIAGVILTAPWPTDRTVGAGGLVGFVSSLLIVVCILLGAFAMVFGGSLHDYLVVAEGRIAARVRRFLA